MLVRSGKFSRLAETRDLRDVGLRATTEFHVGDLVYNTFEFALHLVKDAHESLGFDLFLPVALDKSANTHAICSSKAVRQNKLESRIHHHVDKGELFLGIDIGTPGVLVVRSDVIAFGLTILECIVICLKFT